VSSPRGVHMHERMPFWKQKRVPLPTKHSSASVPFMQGPCRRCFTFAYPPGIFGIFKAWIVYEVGKLSHPAEVILYQCASSSGRVSCSKLDDQVRQILRPHIRGRCYNFLSGSSCVGWGTAFIVSCRRGRTSTCGKKHENLQTWSLVPCTCICAPVPDFHCEAFYWQTRQTRQDKTSKRVVCK